MDADRWERVQELFLAAAELAGADRATMLGAACAGDDELRREVETLLSPIGIEGHEMRTPARAPDPGEHTDEILTELGFGEDEIERLRKRGAIG